MAFKRAPIPLRSELDLDLIRREDPCDAVHVLGSYWPYSRMSFESHVVKGFKECIPARDFEPHISALAEFYARRTVDRVCGMRFDWVVRVLGSAETEPDRERPLNVLAGALCRLTGARDATHLVFKSESRPPMRVVGRLCGSEAMKDRLRYVVQDLFITSGDLGGTVLLIDDIANTGASMRVYACALKSFAGIQRVVAVNLAATRFRSGKDGRGMLTLDTSERDSHPSLRRVLVDSQPAVHLVENCPEIQPPVTLAMKFLAERKAALCPECCGEAKPKRRWWQRL